MPTNNAGNISLSSTQANEKFGDTVPGLQSSQLPGITGIGPKLFGDMSSMASIFSALSNKQQQQQPRHNPTNPLAPNFQQLAQVQALMQGSSPQFNPLQFLNVATLQEHAEQLQKQQQLQQNYTNQLTKFMSYCKDNYMQRLINEKYR